MSYSNRAATFCALAFVALAFTTGSVHADPLPVDGSWNVFYWTAGPGSWVHESPLAFTTGGPVILDVTDAFAPGDRFLVYNNGSDLLGTTSQVNVPANYMADPNATFVHPGFSSGSFALPPGTHSITIQVIQIAEGAPDGAGFIRVRPDIQLSEVPEPGSMTMAGLGLVSLAYVGYRRLRRRPEIETPAV
jgi:hypothetical protein